jgi:hypothetical protein
MFLSAMLANSIDILDCHVDGPSPRVVEGGAERRGRAGLMQKNHCDLCTSPSFSILGPKYYLIILDDFLHYS